MRRLIRSVLLASVLAMLAAGCHLVGGRCDCDYLDPCILRAPWVGEGINGVHPALYNGYGTMPERAEILPKPEKK